MVEGEAGGDRHVVVEGEGGRQFLAAGGVHAQINAFGRDNVATIRSWVVFKNCCRVLEYIILTYLTC